MDLAEHYWFVDRAVTTALVANYSDVLPKTHAAVEAVATSDRFGGIDATDEERKIAAKSMAVELHDRIRLGARAMAKEQQKIIATLKKFQVFFCTCFAAGEVGVACGP